MEESNIANNNSSSSGRGSILGGQSIGGSVNNDSSSNADNIDIDMDMDMDMDTTANTPNKDDGNAETHDSSPIPPLTSISAAIFVPIPDSNKLLQPLNLDPESPDYHRAALDLVTSHENSVRNNLHALFHREMLRMRITANDMDNPPFDYNAARAHIRAHDEDARRRDCSTMIANMCAPDTSNRNYGATNIPRPNMNVPVTYAPVESPREFAATEVMKVIAAAVGDLASFDRHLRNRRATIKKQIQEAEAGKMDID